MKTLITVGRHTYVLPMKAAIAVMNAMAGSVLVAADYSETVDRPANDYRTRYVVQKKNDHIQIIQVDDDQIRIDPDVTQHAPARPKRKSNGPHELPPGISRKDSLMLGFSGGTK